MADNDAHQPDGLLQPIQQPQLPSSPVTLLRDKSWPGKVFDLKARQLRRASQVHHELVCVIEPAELSGDDSDGR